MTYRSRHRGRRFAAWAASALVAWAFGAAGGAVRKVAPTGGGFAELICASPHGGAGIEQFVGAGILPDRSIVLAGNKELSSLRNGKGRGFLLRLTVSGKTVAAGKPISIAGHIDRMKLSPDGNLCLAVDGAGVTMVRPGRPKAIKSCPVRGVIDFGVDSNGELVVLHGRNMTRFDASWKRRKWTASWHAHGSNRPGGMAVCGKTGVAAVVGYGMTHTGREPWKDPYAYGFSRAGKPLWKLWDPKPSKQVSSRHGGNGLMADTTGKLAKAGGGGKILLSLYADGGNSVCTRDPAEPDERIDSAVYEGVYQRGPGHGFKGASKTSVAFRVDAATGKLEKGTWMCAWLTPARANGLGIDDVAADEKGNVYVVGGSASGCPQKQPWYAYESGYQGGGFLAIFDGGLQMRQCGFFQDTSVRCVAAAGGYVVIAGHAKCAAEAPLRVHAPVQDDAGGGEADGFFAIFETGPHDTPAPAVSPQPTPQNAAGRILAEAKQAAADKKTPAARAKLRYLLTRWPDGPEAKEAKALLARLAAAPRPEPAGAESKQQQAANLLQKAENYLRNNMKSFAARTLRQLVKEHPGTPQATEARRLLDEHFDEEE